MTDKKIKPRYESGEPVCDEECPYKESYSHCVTGGCTNSTEVVADGWPCIPALRRSRDNLRKALMEAVMERNSLREQLSKESK